jgi:transcriptional regulator with XRE-family HTH domain
MKFAAVLKKRLKDKNLALVARELGIPKTLLHEWVQSKRMPSFKSIGHLKRLADYLSLSLEELLLEEAEEKVISSVTFDDGGRKYRIKIERVG